MPHGNTNFNKNWLKQSDSQGFVVGQWCREDAPGKGYCILCQKSFLVTNSGFKQVLAHSKGTKHQDLAKARFDTTQKRFKVETMPGSAETSAASLSAAEEIPSTSTSSSSKEKKPASVVLDQSLQEKVTQSELLWAMKVAHSGYSYSSCDDTPSLFKRMFPDSIISDHYSMSRTKVSYLISDGLGPYYRKELCENICKAPGYVIQYDETSNSQVRKQMDVLVRYWSEAKGEVVVQFLKAIMFGHAKGDTVSKAILDALQEAGYQVPLSKLLSLGSDGPNVNKTIWSNINEELKVQGLPGLLPFIPCNMHVVHNSFREGLKLYGQSSEQLAIDLFYFFKRSPCKREDFLDVEQELGFDEELFIRHVQCRWLTLIPALKRIVKNFEPLSEYFLKELPKTAAQNKTVKLLEKNESYSRICRLLKAPAILIQMNFLISLEPLYDRFLKLFQREDPLIHILYSEMKDLMRGFMLRFLKSSIVSAQNTGKKLLEVDVEEKDNQLSDMEIGQSTKSLLDKKKDIAKAELMNMRKFYQTVTQFLQKRLPLTNEILRDVTCLHPSMQRSDSGSRRIRNIALKVPQIIPASQVAQVTDEWKLYSLQEIPESWSYDRDGIEVKIDIYWNKVLQTRKQDGSKKYDTLAKLVKAILCLAHGNAEVERSLSENKKLLTKERTLLSDSSINGLRTVKDAVRVSGGVVSEMPVTKVLVRFGQLAHNKYKRRIEEEAAEEQVIKKARMVKEAERKELCEAAQKFETEKKSLQDKERTFADEDKTLANDLKASEKLFEEANTRLKKAIKDKNFDEAGIAQGLIEVAKNKMNGIRHEMDKNRKNKAELDSKRKKLLENVSLSLKKNLVIPQSDTVSTDKKQ